MTKIAESGSGSISQRHGSADPDPPQNVMDSATLEVRAKKRPIKEGTLFFWVEEAWRGAGQTHQRTHRLRPPAPSAAGSQSL
jgi:hypothetical protein